MTNDSKYVDMYESQYTTCTFAQRLKGRIARDAYTKFFRINMYIPKQSTPFAEFLPAKMPSHVAFVWGLIGA